MVHGEGIDFPHDRCRLVIRSIYDCVCDNEDDVDDDDDYDEDEDDDNDDGGDDGDDDYDDDDDDDEDDDDDDDDDYDEDDDGDGDDGGGGGTPYHIPASFLSSAAKPDTRTTLKSPASPIAMPGPFTTKVRTTKQQNTNYMIRQTLWGVVISVTLNRIYSVWDFIFLLRYSAMFAATRYW